MRYLARAFFFFVVVFALSLGTVTAIAEEDKPAPLPPGLIEQIFIEMGYITGYAHKCETRYWVGNVIPDLCTRVPAVVVADLTKFKNTSSDTYGVFDPFYPTVIYLSDKALIDRQTMELVIAHELVHYFQWRDGQITMKDSCIERIAIEVEAYEAMNQYAVNHRLPLINYSMTIFSMHAGCSGY
jgi:hypothetical protein